MTTSFRSVHFEAQPADSPPADSPPSVIVGLTGARTVHGDTEGVTPNGFHVNTGSYVHVDDVAAYISGEAKQMRDRAGSGVTLGPTEVAEMLSAIAFVIRTSGV